MFILKIIRHCFIYSYLFKRFNFYNRISKLIFNFRINQIDPG
jgi:hypothetical protein